MRKISIIAPILNNFNRVEETMSGILELLKDKYEFEVFYYYCGKLPKDLATDTNFLFLETSPDKTFDDCVTMGFEKADGDAVIVADLNNVNYKDYITKLILEWEVNAQVVLVKKEKKITTFWQKVGDFFVKLKNKFYNFMVGLGGLNKDFMAFRTFQLFSREVAEVIKEFPQKNYYLRNFDTWIDFRVSVLIAKEDSKLEQKEHIVDDKFIMFLCFSSVFIGLLLLVCFTARLVNAQSRSLYVLIGIGLMIASLVIGLYNLYKWFIHKKTKLPYVQNK